jgi:hypothetical protein
MTRELPIDQPPCSPRRGPIPIWWRLGQHRTVYSAYSIQVGGRIAAQEPIRGLCGAGRSLGVLPTEVGDGWHGGMILNESSRARDAWHRTSRRCLSPPRTLPGPEGRGGTSAFGLPIEITGPGTGTEPLLDTVADFRSVAAFAGERTRLVRPAGHGLRHIAVRYPAPDPQLTTPCD